MTELRIRHYRKSDYPLVALHKLRVFNVAHALSPNFLTVLNYHRIDDPHRPGFNTFRPNVSATPSEFASQMEYVSQYYNVISGADLIAFIRGKERLPSRAALITFDDGYLDNYTIAFPILKAKNIPAIIFLATDYIGVTKPFYWDLVAYCFHSTQKDQAELPNLGLQRWRYGDEREKIMLAWIESLKRLPDAQRQNTVDRLPEILDVSIANNAFDDLTISWAQAREMSENGIEMGAHTASHPILTRISLDQVVSELSSSKHRIEEELKKPVSSFAYPNGQLTDFNEEIRNRVQLAGFENAFTLLSGPTRYPTVANQPFAIRRIFLSHEDNFSRFVAKITGVPRIIRRW